MGESICKSPRSRQDLNEDHRRILGGILWIHRTNAPWRDLPSEYGRWQTVATRCEKLATNYLAMVTTAAILIWL
jgi:transposase